MRPPRIPRDATARLLDQVASPAPPRRSTRSHTRLAPAPAAVVCPPRDIEDAVVAPPPAKRRRKAEPPLAGASIATTTAATAPSGWEEIYALVRRMRAPGGAAHGAPVDTMGCERLADPTVSARDRRFHTLVALMLSSQTKDTVNAVAMRRLQTELPPHRPGAPAGLNLANVLAVEPETLNQLIWAVGFHNNKTKYIKKAAEVLRDQWAGDIPDTIEGLTALPGVGPKMGYLCLSAAWGRTEGIGVDVHVHRITNLWGWHRTRTPEETRRALQAWLPRDRWHEINTLLVGLGQAVCVPAAPRCGSCDLGLEGLCRAADKKKVRLGRAAERERGRDGELKNDGEVEVKVALGEFKEETEEKVKNESVNGDVAFKDGNAAEDEVKIEVKSEVRNEVKYNPKDDTEGEELEVKIQVKQYVKDEVEGNAGQIKGEVKGEVTGEINIKDECYQPKEEDFMVKEESKVKDEITVMDISYKVEDQVYAELKQEFKREFKHEIKQES